MRASASKSPPDGIVVLSTGERRRRIMAVLRSQEFARIQDLSRSFGVSEVTIRSDIDVLAKSGGVRRVRGGVMRSSEMFAENRYEERSRVRHAEKEAIGAEAAALLQSNDTVILDSGTTTMAVARAILARVDLQNVTVFTNGLNIALALEPAIPRLQIVVLGGTLRPMQHSLVEPMATLLLERLRASYAFVGCNGIGPDGGIMTTNLPEMVMKRHMLRACSRSVLVADASKFTQEALVRVCGLDEIDILITAGAVAADRGEILRDAGVDLREARPLETPMLRTA